MLGPSLHSFEPINFDIYMGLAAASASQSQSVGSECVQIRCRAQIAERMMVRLMFGSEEQYITYGIKQSFGCGSDVRRGGAS